MDARDRLVFALLLLQSAVCLPLAVAEPGPGTAARSVREWPASSGAVWASGVVVEEPVVEEPVVEELDVEELDVEEPDVESLALAPGDHIVGWRPATGAAGAAALRPLDSPFELERVLRDELARGPITLHIVRPASDPGSGPRSDLGSGDERILGGEALRAIDPERLGTRPSLRPDHLALLRAGPDAWPRLAAALEAGGQTTAAAWLLRALARARAGDTDARAPDAARAALERALALPDLDLAARRALEHELAARLVALGHHDAVDALLRAALARDEALPGDDAALAVARTATSLGERARGRGTLDAAEAHHARALAIHRRLVPGSLLAAGSINELGRVAHARGALDAAERLYREAHEIRMRLAPRRREAMVGLINLGSLASERGDAARAEELLERALVLGERFTDGAEDAITRAAVLNNLAVVATRRGDLERAEDLFTRVLALRERHLPGSGAVASVLNNLSVVRLERGRLTEAEASLRRSLQLRRALDPDGAGTTWTLTNLGHVLKARGDLDGAEPFYREALAVEERHGEAGLRGSSALQGLGDLSMRRGDLVAAERQFRRAAVIAAQEAPDGYEHGAALHNLGEVLVLRGALAAADEVLRRALAIKEAVAPGGSVSQLATLHALSALALRRGRPSDAEALARRGLELADRVAPGSLDEAEAAAALAAALRAEPWPAEPWHAEPWPAEPWHAEPWHDAARADEALAASRRAARALETQSTRLGGSYELRTRFAARFVSIDRQLLQDLLDAGQEREAFEHLERYRARVARAVLAERGLSPPQPLALDAVRHALEPGTLLLSFALTARGVVVFSLRAPGPCDAPSSRAPSETLRVDRLAIDPATLERRIHHLRRSIESLDDPAVVARAAEQLSAVLLAPVAHRLAGAERLLVLPDGPLHDLPFALLPLPTGEEDQLLVDRWPLTVATSATMHAALRARRRTQRPPLLVAFGAPTGDAPPRAGLEMDRVAGAFGGPSRRPHGAQIIRGAGASAARLLDGLPPRTTHLHVAAHGLLDAERPLDSALVLAPRADDTESGHLPAWQIADQLRLDADLVTLSSCHGAAGAVRGGEGLVGLVGAFHQAGARTVLASLWSVSDRWTVDLMEVVYRGLARGLEADEALRQGQLALRTSSAAEARHPFAWAGFRVDGAGTRPRADDGC